ncbi:hypothetical protein GE061_019209 [Apolygus lucorum]|uniref:Uncharacterized protein n=1 Tax=Apolygus lucorum TaxID=248454 RepID=A0A6A4JP29_APOLU|nr:hypothetical protein GE061_019209 [Apolygus lucorum]
MARVGWAEGPDLDCIEVIGAEEYVPSGWSSNKLRGLQQQRKRTSNYEKMEAAGRRRKAMSYARLQCGGTPTGYQTLRTSGITRIPTSGVVRRLDYTTPPRRLRNPVRYMRKRFDEAMACTQRPPGAYSPRYSSPYVSPNYCEACGGPRRCYVGPVDIDPYCHPRVRPPKWPDFGSPSGYLELANMKRFLAPDRRYM